MKKLNKKGGAVSGTVIVAFLVIFLAIFGFVAYKLTSQQTIVPSATTTCTANSDCTTKYGANYQCINGACQKITSTGIASVLNVIAYNFAGFGITPTADSTPTLYVWDESTPNTMLADGSALATTRTAISSGITTGKNYKAVAFSRTSGVTVDRYGEVQSINVGNQESVNVDLKVWNISNDMEVTIFKDGSSATQTVTATAGQKSINFTMGAGETYSFDKIRIKNNVTDSIIYLGGICLDQTNATGNIKSMNINGMTPCTTAPTRLTKNAQCEYCFQFSSPLLLKSYETTETGTFNIISDTNPGGDEFVIRVFDYAPYKSVDNSIKFGFENDALSASDVGTDDFTRLVLGIA